MRLEYNILWIDNDLTDYEKNGDVQSIVDFLAEKGFLAKITSVYDEANLNENINSDFDLIISDFNLNKENGDVIIYRIREELDISTEILFYSAKNNFMSDNPEVKERMAFMERISFYDGRTGLMDKIERVIELTLKKLLDINATRGLITAETSVLDVNIEVAFSLLISKLKVKKEMKPKLEKIFKTDYKEISKLHLKRCKAQRDSHADDFEEYFSVSEAFRKWDILKELLKLYSPDGFDLDLFRNYKGQVIDTRNKFAHAKAEEKDGKLVLKGQYGKEDFEYDDEACIKIRRNLIGHRKNIETLIQALK